jgi:hypothetical protein
MTPIPVLRYYSDASKVERIVPGELPHAIRVLKGPGEGKVVGTGYLSGFAPGRGARPEPLWRLRVGGFPVPGQYALRRGVFVEVDAEGNSVSGRPESHPAVTFSARSA